MSKDRTGTGAPAGRKPLAGKLAAAKRAAGKRQAGATASKPTGAGPTGQANAQQGDAISSNPATSKPDNTQTSQATPPATPKMPAPRSARASRTEDSAAAKDVPAGKRAPRKRKAASQRKPVPGSTRKPGGTAGAPDMAGPGGQKPSPAPESPRPAAAGHADVADATGMSAATPTSAKAGPATSAAKFLLGTRLDVRWGDMDAFNYVNNARFLGYLEEARLRWLQTLPGPWLDENTAPVLAAAHLNYRRPIEWPCALMVELYAERVGSSSLSLGHRIVDAADPDTLFSDGNVVMVWIDRRSGKASPLPAAVRAGCGGDV
jgi:acyl-CoA thioester hydrolase